MTRKKALSFLISFLLLYALVPNIITPAQASDPQQLWALIICGSTGGSFSNNTQYMYHVLSEHYEFDGIYYLDVYTDRPGVDALSTETNVSSAITSWLHDHSDENDIIFIYFTSHGGGYLRNYGFGPFIFHTTYYAIGDRGRVSFETNDENGAEEVRESNFRLSGCPRILVYYDLDDDGDYDDFYWDWDSDERIEMIINIAGNLYDVGELPHIDVDGDGNEDDLFADINSNNRTDILIDAGTWTSDGEDTDNDGYIVGVDLNGDGDRNDWVGIDECMEVQDGWYWDDELASDLDTLNYAKLIFVRQGCLEESAGCFGGGIIDDISAPKRIIMTATNETWPSLGDMDNPGESGYGYSEWSEAFIDALHGQRTHYDNGVVHESPPVYVDADWSNDGHVSMWEAWDYAWKNDEARLEGLETPWLDDNGNGLPTYRNEDDELDPTDGLFSMETYFGFENLKSSDVNDDGVVDIYDINTIANAFGSEPGDPNWNPDADLNNDDRVDVRDITMAAMSYEKCYSDPPGSVSTKTIFFTHPVWTVARKGEAFSVNVVLFNVDNLRGWEFKLYWNNAILECTSAEIRAPDVWGEDVFEAGPGVENDFNATHGRYSIAVSAIYPAPSFNGTMVVATLTFEARAAGSTILDLQDTKLADNEAYAIPHIAIDGSVTVKRR